MSSIVSRNIYLHRLKNKLTQKDLAEKTGISQSYIARLERGKIEPTQRTLETLAKAFNITADKFKIDTTALSYTEQTNTILPKLSTEDQRLVFQFVTRLSKIPKEV